MYGPVPVEVAFFADGGVAWNQATNAVVLSAGIADGVASAGVALRVNLFGFAVGEFDFAHPFQRQPAGLVFPVQSVAGILKQSAGRLAVGNSPTALAMPIARLPT